MKAERLMSLLPMANQHSQLWQRRPVWLAGHYKGQGLRQYSLVKWVR